MFTSLNAIGLVVFAACLVVSSFIRLNKTYRLLISFVKGSFFYTVLHSGRSSDMEFFIRCIIVVCILEVFSHLILKKFDKSSEDAEASS